jgi:hypothetical protein
MLRRSIYFSRRIVAFSLSSSARARHSVSAVLSRWKTLSSPPKRLRWSVSLSLPARQRRAPSGIDSRMDFSSLIETSIWPPSQSTPQWAMPVPPLSASWIDPQLPADSK